MLLIGVTGSIGMGKTTAASRFVMIGAAIWNADQAVHSLYEDPDFCAQIGSAFPEYYAGGRLDRRQLAQRAFSDKAALRRLEGLVHPAVRLAERAFLKKALLEGRNLVVLDIPLLLETAREKEMDVVVTVSTSKERQKARVLARPQMTAKRFAAICRRQMPDCEKRRKSHFIIDSGGGLAHLDRQIWAIFRAVAGQVFASGRKDGRVLHGEAE